MRKTITADNEKILGLFIISDNYLTMSQIPSANDYDPKIIPKQVVHTLSDGGIRIQNIRKKFSVKISMDYISSTLRDSLYDIFNLNSPFIFCPFGTTTGWDSFVFDSIWQGEFGFYEFSNNAAVSGFSGDIMLKETPF